ncbi:MAG TPA: c-type cytochrome [Anaerolineales bacterium]|nr:c-type cytochrome [Anaerolineales bacterium]
MHIHLRTLAPLSLGLMVALGACTAPETPTAPPPGPEPEPEVELSGSAPEGGRLYDRWWREAGVDQPPGDQPLWSSQSTNTRTGGDTWRCKECHGWDYQGADGAYGSGSHFTGFPGVFGSSGLSDAELLAWLDGSANADHDFSAMGTDSLANLATFLQEELVDVAPFIDAETKAAIGGDGQAGAQLYEGNCTACHGADGLLINFGDDAEPEYLGTIALDNPWEFIHKVRAGQPGTAMPAAIDLGWTLQQVVDVLTFAQTLPTEASVGGSVSEGGKLYDKWWTTVGLDTPDGDNPLWARQSTNERSGGDTWRCKECHGWDYAGADGAYGSGSHFTGFPGVFGAQDKSAEELLQMLSGEVDADHDYSAMGPEALTDLITFLKEALVDLAPVIDASAKAPVAFDAGHGQELYSSACTACHGEDGRTLNFGDDAEPEYLGTIAVDNPWEFVHKVRFGQPGEGMPASEDTGWTLQDVLDVLGYAQTLPTE